MARLLILAHAPLASAFQAAAAHTFPELVDRIRVLDVQADDQPEPVEASARLLREGRRLERQPDGTWRLPPA